MPTDGDAAHALLVVLSLLHQSETPVELFQQHDDAAVTAVLEQLRRKSAGATAVGDDDAILAVAALFLGAPRTATAGPAPRGVRRSAFHRAAGLLRQFGLLLEPGNSQVVGVMHQQVQRAVRERFVFGPLKEQAMEKKDCLLYTSPSPRDRG